MASLAVGVQHRQDFLSQSLNAPFVIQGQFSLAHSFSQKNWTTGIGRTQLEVSEELESPRVSSPGFGNDSKMMVM
ncbi:hypothetical protein TNCV_4903681 [Trichonephila clavipes]|uniref:Uncharacterized protein n=1 Tax=Trichonephila clavipes TaxID=2585209 RepID=A0A8X6S7H2_TRICX|nr:hypothetical protein TNCV_4903681 [Trichonephila clavipes]